MEDAIVAADACVPGNDAVVADAAAFTNFNIAVDHRVCADTDASPESGARIDDCGWMNAHALRAVYGLAMVRWVHSNVASLAI